MERSNIVVARDNLVTKGRQIKSFLVLSFQILFGLFLKIYRSVALWSVFNIRTSEIQSIKMWLHHAVS